ncbi:MULTISPECIES: FliO/MopB family protein [Clostridium]|jgi:Flagellar biogenesis protein|uniref:Flagellar formation protein n=4 Tax=Clostridium TaxID=1485 RepID=A0A0B5QST9_CLOBE|nr:MULTISPECIES: flagellar biosynthetic protein FliO [Clostridium]AJH01307.1 flagellar formation protein [Clostridium beijerinckii]ALB44552.1 flagellar formation protein [Clostridium beijerinckii NRRL B-598]AQS07113.1 putative bifunctional flagellar biosynthesis protein FliO/FliP [Clostridium beijerinckii]AVK48255.1 flagellar formation protein [Clostridium sp. MF28]MBA2883609.1 flagellar protein FliO/FliZ [Clostridium beijerinckii]
MNFGFLGMIVQLILALGVTLGLIFLSFKLANSKFNVINNNKYIKVIERVQVTKDNSILIVKIGEKGYIMTSTAGHMEKLSELSREEIDNIEEDKKKASQEMAEYYTNLVLKSKKNFSKITKNIKSKEEKHEK